MPFPELKMRSTKSRAAYALASQCGKGTSVWKPAARSRSRATSTSRGKMKMSRSFVHRAMPVYRSMAYAPPTT